MGTKLQKKKKKRVTAEAKKLPTLQIGSAVPFARSMLPCADQLFSVLFSLLSRSYNQQKGAGTLFSKVVEQTATPGTISVVP